MASFRETQTSGARASLMIVALCGLIQLTGCTAIPNEVSLNPLTPGEFPKPGVPMANALVSQAHEAYHRGDLRLAQWKLRRALQHYPQSAPAHVLTAQIARDLGRPAECVAELRAAAAADPNSAHLQFDVGQQLLQQRDYASALPILRRSTELDPHQPKYVHVLAAAYREAGQRPQADALVAELSRRYPDNRDVQTLLTQLQRTTTPRAPQALVTPEPVLAVKQSQQPQPATSSPPRFGIIASLLQPPPAQVPTVLPEIQQVSAVTVHDGWHARVTSSTSGWKPHRSEVSTEHHIQQTSCLIEVVDASAAERDAQPLVAADLTLSVR
jgi:Tfp pilus assembly protein PilF